ncbi:MAG: energy-coupling factor ABC transporter ATP-binding protein [Lactovum sp.]
MAVIEVKSLKYRYPKTEKIVLKNLNFTIKKGEFIGIIGGNGAGKSSLLLALSGLIPQFFKGTYAGQIKIAGLSLPEAELSEIASSVGLIFQNPFVQMTGARTSVFEEIAFGLENLGLPRKEIQEKVRAIMEELDISELSDRSPFSLSGGQMQHVAIASILVMSPQILLLDEPTSQLDPQSTRTIFELVKKLKEKGITILMVEQKMEKIAEYSDRVLLMHDGNLIDIDETDRIFSREDLAEFGVEAPIYTQLGRKLNLKMENDNYPSTEKDLKELLR